MRLVLFVLGALAVFGLTASADNKQKPDIVVTAEQYAKEYVADKNAFEAKYKGKTVEVTGTVWNMHLSSGGIYLNGYKKDAKDVVGKLVVAKPPKIEGQLRSLSQGQQVTVRGKQDETVYPQMVDCEFVKIGPSTAIPATMESLAAEFKNDPDKAGKKYKDKSVVLQAKIIEAKVAPKNRDAEFVLTDTAGKSGLRITAKADLLLDEQMVVDMRKLKVGDVAVFMGDAYGFGKPFGLDAVFLLKEPPPGVKLPGDKK